MTSHTAAVRIHSASAIHCGATCPAAANAQHWASPASPKLTPNRFGVSRLAATTARIQPMMSPRQALLVQLARRIPPATAERCIRVAVDGPDGSGKTTLADELAGAVRAL